MVEWGGLRPDEGVRVRVRASVVGKNVDLAEYEEFWRRLTEFIDPRDLYKIMTFEEFVDMLESYFGHDTSHWPGIAAAANNLYYAYRAFIEDVLDQIVPEGSDLDFQEFVNALREAGIGYSMESAIEEWRERCYPYWRDSLLESYMLGRIDKTKLYASLGLAPIGDEERRRIVEEIYFASEVLKEYAEFKLGKDEVFGIILERAPDTFSAVEDVVEKLEEERREFAREVLREFYARRLEELRRLLR